MLRKNFKSLLPSDGIHDNGKLLHVPLPSGTSQLGCVHRTPFSEHKKYRIIRKRRTDMSLLYPQNALFIDVSTLLLYVDRA